MVLVVWPATQIVRMANNLLAQIIASRRATQFAEFKIELVALLMQLEFISCRAVSRSVRVIQAVSYGQSLALR